MNYLLCGSEHFLIKKKMNEIIKEWVQDESDFSVLTYDASVSEFNMSTVIQDASTIPFFTSNKVIVLKNCDFLSASVSISESDVKILENYLKQPCETTVLIFILEKEKLDARKKIVKMIRKECREIKCDALLSEEFSSVLKAQIRQRKISIDKEAISELEQRCSLSLSQMENELEKLSLIEHRISKEDIELLVSRPLEDKAFDLVNALIQGNMKLVFRIWNDLKISKTDPILINTLIGRQFHLIYQVQLLSRKGKNEQVIAQILKVHPYSVKLAHQSSRRISADLLKQLIQECADLDQKLKTGISDRILGFEHFLIHTAGRMNACRH